MMSLWESSQSPWASPTGRLADLEATGAFGDFRMPVAISRIRIEGTSEDGSTNSDMIVTLPLYRRPLKVHGYSLSRGLVRNQRALCDCIAYRRYPELETTAHSTESFCSLCRLDHLLLQSKPDKDVGLTKINVASQFKTGQYLTLVAAYIAAEVAIMVVWFESNTTRFGWLFDGVLAVIVALIGIPLYVTVYRPLSNYMGYLNYAIKQIESGKGVGDLDDVIKAKRR
jgi:hypothetical protein